MFARITSLDHLGDLQANGDLALAWLELASSQSFLARRQRLQCPAFSGTSSSSSGGAPPSMGARPHGRHPQQRAVRCHALRSGRRYRALTTALTGHRLAQVLQQQARELQQQQQQQQQPDATISISSISSDSSSSSSSSRFDPQQLMACINAAATLSQLEAVCNTCLAHAAFSPRHAAAVLGRLHAVQCRPRDSPLLLVELLAQRLPAGCSGTPHAADVARAQQLTCSDVAWSCWVFARVGYSPGPVLLQQLLAQFWHCQSQGSGSSNGEALATLVAGLAGLGCRDASVWARIHAAVQAVLHQQQQRQQSQPQPQLPIASLQQLAWGFAAMQGAGNVATTAALARALRGRLQELMAAEDLATTVWCLHLLGCTDRELFEAAARQMLQRASAKAPAAGPRARGGQQAALQHNHQQQQQQQQWRQRPASPQRLLALAAGDTAARCTAAASSALGVLQQYDPLLCMLAVYRDHCQPATS